MGTSTSNRGQSGNTPLVPSWLSDNDDDQNPEQSQPNQSQPAQPQPADTKRFSAPRGSFTRYVNSGGNGSGHLHRAASNYVRHSLGGSQNATTRLGSARNSTTRLLSVFNSFANRGVEATSRDYKLGDIIGKSASDVLVQIMDFVCPDGGSTDEGIARNSYIEALYTLPDWENKPFEDLTPPEFLVFAEIYMSGMKGVSTLEVPENGLIALNIPLDELRTGSHSTRTTHPFYLDSWNQVLQGLEIEFSVHNPYWNKTKGEMADECLDKEFLMQVIQDSISCSSPQKARWSGATPQHCGYCVPCIIRRAAMNKAFRVERDNTPYLIGSVSEITANHAKGKGVQLRSFQIAIKKIKEQPQLAKILIHKSGPLSGDSAYLRKLSEVYRRGLLEVDAWIIKNSDNGE